MRGGERPRPEVVAPPPPEGQAGGMAEGSVSRILVGVDGSAASQRALEWSADLARALDAEVVAVHAAGLLDRLRTEESGGELADSFRDEWRAPLEASGVRHRCVVVDGPPPMAMLRAAEQEAADLIVVGSRGLGAEPAQVLGSTSRHLVQHAPVPVTVLPAG